MSDLIAPLNRIGDIEGSRHNDDGTVTTPAGFVDAYRQYVAAGWGGVPFPPTYGGGGFPWLVGVAMQEILTSANMAFSMAPLLTQGAIDMLLTHGSEAQRETFLPKMVSGEWTGTMNLTEPEAGSDVGALRTKAVPADDGSWRISGTKIFISFGEHDMADNIVHLVLARVPDAPPGTKGISCFIVPKVLEDGKRNAVTCIGIEHKMGIHASPTCTMEYDGAVGWLVGGEPNRGMSQMFTMMNNARLSVGLSGLAIGERAYQAAVSYAGERVQGQGKAIVEHPDVRRMLLHIRSHIDAMRALVYTNAWAIDLAKHGRDDAERTRGQELADLLTPITKAWCTDLGSELARLATQVHGGMGYIAETGVEQHERDIRIAAIYEGTNGIQAMDLVARKLPMRSGAVVLELLDRIDADADAADRPQLTDAVAALREATEWLLAKGLSDPRNAFAGSTPYLRMFGTVLGGWFLARQAAVGDDARAASARYYLEQVLPTARGLLPAVTAGADSLDAYWAAK
jgi:alkylation response protein AidB-like acyl-CoA dehydrogenase